MSQILQPKQAAELGSGKRTVLLDVRTPIEHAEKHIPGSHLMPLDQLDPEVVKSMSADADCCLLICQGGKRASQAAEKLASAGCGNLAILNGGIAAWESAGLPLERGEKVGLPLMRQVQLIIGLLALTGSILALTVDPRFALLPAFLGAGLTMAGATGWCGLAILLSKMPWNRVGATGCSGNSCSV
ncbi:MAG: rhodanese-like domain-containing protein [Luteolibacter sp.]